MSGRVQTRPAEQPMIQATQDARESLPKGRPAGQTTETDAARLGRALALVEKAHGDRARPSGDTYLDHARAVAVRDDQSIGPERPAATSLDVRRIDPRRMNLDAHLPGASNHVILQQNIV